MKYTVTKNQGDPYWHVEEDGKCIAMCFTKPDATALKGILSKYATFKAKADLLDEAVGLRSELYAALGVLILATPTGNYRNDLTKLNIRFMEHIRKAKELTK